MRRTVAGITLVLVPMAVLALGSTSIHAQTSFQPRRTVKTLPGIAHYLATGNLDADQRPDIVVSNFTLDNAVRQVFIYYQTAPLSFSEFRLDHPSLDGTIQSQSELSVADFNNDGNQDVMLNMDGYRLKWYRNDDPVLNTFTPAGLAHGRTAAENHEVVDLDCDGLLDVLEAGFRGPILAHMNPGGGFTPDNHTPSGIGGAFVSAEHGTFEAADFDLDGDPDVAFPEGFIGDSWVLVNDLVPGGWPLGIPVFSQQRLTQIAGIEFHGLRAVDLDRDGRPDVVLNVLNTGAGTGELLWLRNVGPDASGKPAFAAPVSLASGADMLELSIAEMGDFDCDGDIDIVAGSGANPAHPADNRPLLLLDNDGSQNFSRIVIDPAFNTESVDAVDLDGDGDLDIVAAGFVNGEVAYWLNSLDPAEPCPPIATPALCGETVCEEPDPRTQGYWHRQCLGLSSSDPACPGIDPGRSGRGPAEPNEPRFCPDLYDCADTRLEDLGFYGTRTCEGIDADPASDACERALKQLTALILNLCSRRLEGGCAVDVTERGCEAGTVATLIDEVAGLIHEGRCNQASDCAGAVNEGDALIPDGSAAGSADPEATPGATGTESPRIVVPRESEESDRPRESRRTRARGRR